MLLTWMGGWTVAMVVAGLKARAVALAPVASREKLPGKSALVTR
jgi:hypothetical protein